MNKAQMHLSVSEMGVPKYRINPGGGEMFAVLDLGLIQLFIFDPAELRRLADVAANAADVLEQAQRDAVQRQRYEDGRAPFPVNRHCSHEAHIAMKNPRTFRAMTDFHAHCDDGAGGTLEMRNCRAEGCTGTLAMDKAELDAAEGAGLARVAG